MSSQNMLLLYPMISISRDQVSAALTGVQFFVINKSWWSNNSNSSKSYWENPRTELPKRAVNLNYTLLNRFNGAGLIFLFKEGSFLIIRRLSFSCNTNLLSCLVSALKLSKDGEWSQSNKWSLTALPLCITLFFVNLEILISSPFLTLKCLTYSS